ncbi:MULTISPECIES: hypothetical protein [Alphaproteobacteria]|uniref:Antifreeze protein n=2 Tax=Alphaproteobacteria TaxID=28211 RepID=A0A512HE53_9HYPH|nr:MULTISPECIES: hypothetical protein [Alphaproteobacteria]GEO83729.1 hypothetical protein RNA01_06610 [Ciceribacter naphthalenivorans]GLR24119.1 hypothetical protein GCM10007920_39130 [Ciceribacter naphthalenivorans]GLT06975.1 hypothetical protein GCM10007926_39130 [Sphingomonas psychrolutea]
MIRRFLNIAFAGLLLAPAMTVPAMAGEAELAAILFGRNYNDGVTAVSVSPGHAERGAGGPAGPAYQTPARMRAAQAQVSRDPVLQAAIARRKIALHNVIWVQTAANGGRIVYYR